MGMVKGEGGEKGRDLSLTRLLVWSTIRCGDVPGWSSKGSGRGKRVFHIEKWGKKGVVLDLGLFLLISDNDDGSDGDG
ncbi:hypothetical protein RJT34_04050 [Clitoria ternatea]|uniref:Uncharacterized protein n=1 Tax=Clitoria ternatea TaxID=43366 RepID=A0AAN9KMR9_CLITE